MDRRLPPTTRLACLWLLLSGHQQPAYAQSDGTYCVGPAYLAYERARPPAYDSLHGAIPPLHTLHVLRVDTSGAIATHLRINLPFFTVHGMQCLPAHVRVLGWDSLYTITVAGAAPYSVTTDVAPWAGQGSSRPALPEYPDSTLWHGWNPAAVVTVLLPLTANRHRLALSITGRETSQQMCRYRVTTRLVLVGATQPPRDSPVLYNEVLPGECGE